MSRQRGVEVGKRGGPISVTAATVTKSSRRTVAGVFELMRYSTAGRLPSDVS